MPIHATITDGVVAFEANSDKDFKKVKLPKENSDVGNEDVMPSWFATLKFEITSRRSKE